MTRKRNVHAASFYDVNVQLRLAYSCARPAILVAGKGRGGMFLSLLFLHFHSCFSFFLSLSFISSTISSISFLPFSGRRHKMTHTSWRVVKVQLSQSVNSSFERVWYKTGKIEIFDWSGFANQTVSSETQLFESE